MMREQGDSAADHGRRPRDHHGPPAEAGEPVPQPGMVPLAHDRLVLADGVPAGGQGPVVGGVLVGAVQPHAPALQPDEQAVQRRPIAPAALPVDQPAVRAGERPPDPELLGLFLTKCQTSSSSTTHAVPGSGSGRGQCRSA
jgi:hypothetical protein